MSASAQMTKIQKMVFQAMTEGKTLSATYGAFEIDLGERRRVVAGGELQPIKTRVSMSTVKSMVDKGLIIRVVQSSGSGVPAERYALLNSPGQVLSTNVTVGVKI